MAQRKQWTFIALVIVVLLALYWLFTQYYVYTSDAYLEANVVPISAEVSGKVAAIYIHDNQRVKRGQKLFLIDPEPYRYTLNRAEGELKDARDTRATLRAAVRVAEAKVKEKKSYLRIAHSKVKRIEPLVKTGNASIESGIEARNNYVAAEADVTEAEQELAYAKAALGPPQEEYSQIQIAKAKVRLAKRNLRKTIIYAPSDGYVTNFYLRPGHFVEVGQALFPMVDTEQWWVTARFKETALNDIKPQAKTTLSIDMYLFHLISGQVRSVSWGINRKQASSEAAESSLSYLQPTENWIRLAQRFPVRITLPPEQQQYPYRVGANVRVWVHR